VTAPKKNARHLTPVELAERLGGDFSVDTLKYWRTTGQGPAYLRVGKYVRYRESDVEAWEKTRLVTTSP